MAPYRDLLEINMPGIYLVNWSVMHALGAGSVAWRVFDFALMGVAAWAMIVIAWPYEWLAGVFGATLFILFHGRDGAGQDGSAGFHYCRAVVVRLRISLRIFSPPAYLAHVCLRALCRVSGHHQADTVAVCFAPFSVLAAVRWKRTGEPITKPVLYALGGLATPLAIVCAFLIYKHALHSFWYLLRVVLPFYETLGRVPVCDAAEADDDNLGRTVAVIALTIAVMKRDWWNWEGKLLVLGILFGFASYFGQGKAFAYHRYPMLAFLFLWAGLQITTALRAQRRVRPFAIAGVTFVVILAPLYVREASRKVWDPKFADSLTTDLSHLGGQRLSGHIQCIYTPADCDAVLYRMRLSAIDRPLLRLSDLRLPSAESHPRCAGKILATIPEQHA